MSKMDTLTFRSVVFDIQHEQGQTPMQILSSSFQKVGSFFLHAGYISMRRAFSDHDAEWILKNHQPVLKLDMAEALRLHGEVIGSVGQTHDSWLGSLSSSINDPATMIMGIAGFCLFIAAAYHFRKSKCRRSIVYPIAIFGMAMTVLAVSAGGPAKAPPNNQSVKPPWEGMARRAYEHPEDATKAMLYGIIADGIVNTKGAVTSLVDIQGEVGIPSNTLTEGQQYALATYGYDGWGRPFKLSSQRNKAFVGPVNDIVISSDGKDGKPETEDDIKASICPPSPEAKWEYHRWAYFLRELDHRKLMLIHRWKGEDFQYRNRRLAKQLTGGLLFDAVPLKSAFPAEMYQQFATSKRPSPLILVVFHDTSGNLAADGKIRGIGSIA